MVQGIKVEFIVDIGVVRIILFDRFYLRFFRDKRLELIEIMSFVVVNGDVLKVMGKVMFQIQLGNFVF